MMQVGRGVAGGVFDRLPRDRGLTRICEGHRQRWEKPLQPQRLGRFPEGQGLRCLVVRIAPEGILLRSEHRFDLVVVGLEVSSGDRPLFDRSVISSPDEPVLVWYQDQVGSGTMTIAPHGHSATQIPQPLQ